MVNKITEADLINKGVVGLPDVPGLTTIEMQNKFEEISRDVIIPRFNELIDCTVSASDEFSKLSTYNVGDYCIYQGVLYKCTTAITTAGEWDATKWKATSIDKELKEISSSTENKDVISDKYDSSKTYAVGDYCIYNDTLYKCKTAVTSAEEFDSSKWEATNCGKELVALNSNLLTVTNWAKFKNNLSLPFTPVADGFVMLIAAPSDINTGYVAISDGESIVCSLTISSGVNETRMFPMQAGRTYSVASKSDNITIKVYCYSFK